MAWLSQGLAKAKLIQARPGLGLANGQGQALVLARALVGAWGYGLKRRAMALPLSEHSLLSATTKLPEAIVWVTLQLKD